jgi:hypothetical protein
VPSLTLPPRRKTRLGTERQTSVAGATQKLERIFLRSPGVDSQGRSDQSGVWTLTLSSGRWMLNNRKPSVRDDWFRDVSHDQMSGSYSTSGTGIAFVQNTPCCLPAVRERSLDRVISERAAPGCFAGPPRSRARR